MSLKLREKTRDLHLGRISSFEEILKTRRPVKEKQRRALVLRTLFQMLPGKTFREKQKQYRELRLQRKLPEFLGIKTMRRGAERGTMVSEAEQTAGIEKMWPSWRDALADLAKGKIRRKDTRSSPVSRRVLDTLEAAGIIEKTYRRGASGRGKQIVGFKKLDNKRFYRTLKTGYVQWPELSPYLL